ncbi:MAG: DNA polymerase Y family protein [Dehalococcoidia bacterium]
MRVACFFFPHFPVQVETIDDCSLRGRPVIIGGLPYERKAVCDVSKEALACGVRQGMLLREAYALCPQGVFLPPDEGKYAAAFTTVLTLLTSYSPVVEAGHRELCHQPSRRTSGVVVSPPERSVFVDVGKEGPDNAAELQLVEEVRRMIEKRLRLYPFVSVASNKFVARTASQIAGPGQVMVVTGREGKDFLKDLPVCLLPASSVTLERLELLGIYRIGQLAALSPAALSLEFGNEGEWLWELSNGIDGSRLTPWSEVPVLKEQIHFEPAAESMDQVLAGGDKLLTALSRQLKERWQSCLRLTISMHFSNDHIAQRVFHFKEATSSRETMLRHLKHHLESARFTAPVSEIRLTLTDLCPESGRQVPISSGFLDERVKHSERLASAISWLRQRYGKSVVGRVLARPNSALPEDSFSFTELDL